MAGRPRITDEVKAKRGTLKKHRVNTNQPSSEYLTVDELKSPTYFNKYAKAFFYEYGKQCIELGILKKSDLMSFEALATQVGIYQEALYDIKKNGMYSTGTNKNGSTYKMQSPSINIQNNAYKQILTGLSKFGLTPSDRSKIIVSLPEVKTDEVRIDDFLN